MEVAVILRNRVVVQGLLGVLATVHLDLVVLDARLGELEVVVGGRVRVVARGDWLLRGRLVHDDLVRRRRRPRRIATTSTRRRTA